MIFVYGSKRFTVPPEPPGPVTNIRTEPGVDYIDIWWNDPADNLWRGSYLVRNTNHYPQNPQDGVLVTDNRFKNQYASLPFRDEGLEESMTYYYCLFPYSRKDIVTMDDACRFTAHTRIRRFTITFMSEGVTMQTLTLDRGTMPSYSGEAISTNKAGDRDFDEWSPPLAPAQGDQVYNATFKCLLHYRPYDGVGEDLHVEQVKHGADGIWDGTATREKTQQYTYTFAGWASRANGAVDASCRKGIQNDLSVYAAFTATVNKYTVTFMNGSSVYDTVKVDYGSSAVCSKTNPTKSQTAQYTYSFVGWANSDGQASGVSGILDNITADKTVYAAYSRTTRSYTVKFYNGTSLYFTDTVLYGGTASCDLANPTKDPTNYYVYTFVGWASSNGATSATSGILSNITSDKTVYAAYSSSTRYFTVTFMNGSSVYDTVKVTYGSSASCSKSNPTKARDNYYVYTFVGWASSDGQTSATSGILSSITADKTVYAAYSRATRYFTVTFMNGSSVYDTDQVTYGSTASCSKSNPTKSQTAQYTYSFVGWASYDGATSASSTILQNITSDKTVYAAYSRTTRSYTVTFMNGSSVWDTDTVLYGGTASCDRGNPTKSSTTQYEYSFVGWNSSNNQSTATSGILTNITGDKTVYAAYSSSTRKYTITWKDWDGYSLGTTQVAYGSTPSYSGTPSFSGWTFKGWKPGLSSVTGPATYTADYTMPTGMSETITKSWDQIIADSKNGSTSGYSTGATKIAVLSDRTPICFELAGINQDSAGHFTFIAKTLYGRSTFSSSSSNYHTGGYVDSVLRSYVQNTYSPKLPSNIRNGAKTVTKYCSVAEPENDNQSYTDKFWVPNFREMNSDFHDYTCETLGPQYTYYNSNARRVRYKPDGSDYDGAWDLSTDASTTMVKSVTTSGKATGSTTAAAGWPVIIGFVI